MRRPALLALAMALGCTLGRTPELDPTERVRGERIRLVQEPFERLWPAVLAALPDEGIGVARADRKRGAIATDPIRYTGQEVQKRLADIGDLAQARRAGLRHVSELSVTYYILMSPSGDAGTSVRIRSSIDAIDRSGVVFPGGLFDVVPVRVEVPSRGVAERDLLRRLAANLFTAEEMLFLLGEPGVD